MTVSLFAAVGSLAAISSAANIGSLTFRLERQERFCFYQKTSVTQSSINLQFEVIEGHNSDIGFRITRPDGSILKTSLASFEPRRGGLSEPMKVNFADLDRGRYEICFDNGARGVSADYKVITMADEAEWLSKQQQKKQGDERAAHSTEMDDLTRMAQRLNRELEHPVRLQEYIKKRMHRHLWTVESTSTRRDWMTIFQMTIVIVAAIGQTMWIKGWFASKGRGFRV